MTLGIIFAILCALGAIGYGVMSRSAILALPDGTDKMKEISLAIQEGAEAYLKRQYTTIAIVYRHAGCIY